jgi:hypothetical protein
MDRTATETTITLTGWEWDLVALALTTYAQEGRAQGYAFSTDCDEAIALAVLISQATDRGE